MQFNVTFLNTISDDAKIVVPISISGYFLAEEKTRALLEELKKLQRDKPQINITVVIADSLDRFNTGNEKASLTKGDDFIKKYANELQNLNVMRWKEFHDDERYNYSAVLKSTEALYNKDNIYAANLKNTVKSVQQGQITPEENSIKLLLEECAVYRIWNDLFTNVVYPRPISKALKKTRNLFKLNNLNYTQVSVKETTLSAANNPNGLFNQNSVNKKHLSPVFEGLLIHVGFILSSDQMKPSEKIHFAHRIRELISFILPEATESEKTTDADLSNDDNITTSTKAVLP
ncbi:MAG: hypothetical protein Tsb005_14370 [Gammaproteobacteria bacterium]